MGHPLLKIDQHLHQLDQGDRRLTQLVVGKDPADSPDSCGCSYNAIQSNLPYLNEGNSLGRGIDYKVVEYILISVHEK